MPANNMHTVHLGPYYVHLFKQQSQGYDKAVSSQVRAKTTLNPSKTANAGWATGAITNGMAQLSASLS